jgi:hypothetical protein
VLLAQQLYANKNKNKKRMMTILGSYMAEECDI